MDPIQALATTSQRFIALVGQVSAEQWDKPTPCEQRNVRSLVGHVITSTQGYAELLHGAPAPRLTELGTQKSTIGGNDVLTAVIDAAAQARAAFVEPGALERMVHHPMGDLPGSRLLWSRIVDDALHGYIAPSRRSLGSGAGPQERLLTLVGR